jgi:hypothetical protein
MHRHVPTRLSLFAALVAVVAAGSLAGLAYGKPHVPSEIAVQEGHKLYLVGHAVGVQIYQCNAIAGGGYGWAFLAPRANVYGKKGELLMTHFGGPTWQATDGSTVVGTRLNGVTVDPSSIPWLLLSASSAPGPDGDLLAGTTFVQRIATTGGLAPAATECNEGTAGVVREVPYTSDYTFWKAKDA